MLKDLIKALKGDSDLYNTYKSNIAMSFKDSYYKSRKKYKNNDDIHQIANNAAIDFLNNLIGDKNEK